MATNIGYHKTFPDIKEGSGGANIITFNVSLTLDNVNNPTQWILTISNATELFNALAEINQDATKLLNYNFFADIEELESGTVYRNLLYPVCDGNIRFETHETFCCVQPESVSMSQITIRIVGQTPLSLSFEYYYRPMGVNVYNYDAITTTDITEDDTIVITLPYTSN